MADRKKIALTYAYNENWIAGSYYVVNIIKALNSLPDASKPDLYILHERGEGVELIEEVNYPFITFIDIENEGRSFPVRIMNKLYKKITGNSYSLQNSLSGVNHIFEGSEKYPFIKHHYYWVHDFQEFRLPEFFSKEDAEKRSVLPRRVSKLANTTLIVSSYDALNDFKTFFPGYKCDVRVWRFASSLPDYSMINIIQEKSKFNITAKYFLCSNQFWQHKNHQVILNAISLLKDKNLDFQVVFTGKNFDHRNPQYFESLQKYISDNKLERWTNFVGFIDRKVQLCLGKNAVSYIQPSFFEGWSTTVEDAKCLNQYVILSDIPVHREQLNYNVSFFNPKSAEALAAAMLTVLNSEHIVVERDYNRNIIEYGNDILATFVN